MKNFSGKCFCSTAGIGICLCTIFMTIGMTGTTLVGLSKSSASMAGMSSMTPTSESLIQNIVNFFSGIWGEVVLLISFGLMFYGMWSSGGNKKKLISISMAAIAVLYISMYVYFSLVLELVGSAILALTYASAFSGRFAELVKLG